MKPTIEILTKLQENSVKNHDEVFTKLFRYTLRPDIYYVAYQNLYANNGAATKGVNEDTADGFNEDYVTRIYEVHHVNKVKNLRGKEPWEVVMIAKKRKTLVVCHDCHQMIHHGF